jgi:ABC-2 type transport system permease protein
MTAATVDGAAAPRTGSSGSVLTGTGTLIRFVLRRDRVRIPIWVGSIVLLVLASVQEYPTLYATAADRQARAEVMENPAAVALSGPGYGLDDYTYGAMTANELLGFVAIVVALMSILLVVRHTRTEEETGRAELVRAAVVGRHAGTTATLVVVGAVNVLIGLLFTIGLPAALDELSVTGSFYFGMSVASVGFVFAAVAALAAQVTEHARGAAGIAGAALGLAFLLRAAGDIGNGALSWLSPLGWATQTRAYVDERFWPLLLSLGLTALLVVAAFVLSARRDVGAGMVAPRLGRPAATAALRGPLGLAVRLQRASLAGWAAGVVIFGLVYGSLVGDVEEFVSENSQLEDFLASTGGATPIDSFAAMMMTFLALLAAGFAMQSVLRARGEETSGRAEPILSAAVRRERWAGSHLAIALVGSAALVVLGAGCLGVVGAIVLDDGSFVTDLLGAALANIPGVWLVVGIAVALFGLAPRALPVVWVVLAYAVTVWMLGGFLQFPEWMYDLSPFGHSELPAQDLTVAPFVLGGLAAALIGLGLVGVRRRDLDTG